MISDDDIRRARNTVDFLRDKQRVGIAPSDREIADVIDALLAERELLMAENTKLHGWVKTEAQAAGTLQRKLNAALNERERLTARHEWLDWMIAYWQERGE